MKRYDTDDVTIKIRFLTDPHLPHTKILNIQYYQSFDIKNPEEVEIVIPEYLSKAKVSSSGFAKHILNYFIKD